MQKWDKLNPETMLYKKKEKKKKLLSEKWENKIALT